ncbi:hypothetical protein SAMN06295900_103110 [Trinickia caryophylli]|uniref:Uncharacterized protein n=1 Tax=Trinickia caryophylli TaxID=28094 RepID=A0A1X7DF34_TRICW|nr:hypothetical protein SAMN06295900_103110 [Trinickia caryophylli]
MKPLSAPPHRVAFERRNAMPVAARIVLLLCERTPITKLMTGILD